MIYLASFNSLLIRFLDLFSGFKGEILTRFWFQLRANSFFRNLFLFMFSPGFFSGCILIFTFLLHIVFNFIYLLYLNEFEVFFRFFDIIDIVEIKVFNLIDFIDFIVRVLF